MSATGMPSPFASTLGQVAAQADPSPSQHVAPTSNMHAPASRAVSDVVPPADRATSTTALLAGTGPTSSLTAPTLTPIEADDLLSDVAADIGADAHGSNDMHKAHKAGIVAAAGSGNGRHGTAFVPQVSRSPSGGSGRRKRMIPLRQVLRHSYEYHGLNELAMFCITALAVSLVLYWHWGTYTAIFKASVQQSFQSYGNPDWQTQTMKGVDTMNDAVEYGIGWLEFWLQRSDMIDLPSEVVRAQDYADLQYIRILANLDRNCNPDFSPHMSCYKNDPLYQPMLAGAFGNYSHSHPRNVYGNNNQKKDINPDLKLPGYANLLEWAGWSNVFQLKGRDSTEVGDGEYWWAYTVVAPKYYNRTATRDDYIGRMYNITRQTSLNINNCDWLATNCSQYNQSNPNPCAAQSVPFQNWFSDSSPQGLQLCPDANTTDQFHGPGVQRGNRTFVRDPKATTPGVNDILDLKAYLGKYAYSIVIDVLAANTFGDGANPQEKEYSASRDRALFSLLFQRSATADEKPNRIMWQISTTLPVRTSFYVYKTDFTRIWFEALMLLCVAVVVYYQVLQFRICLLQFRSWKPFFAHYWNDYEIFSTLLLVTWIVWYCGIAIQLAVRDDHWKFGNWDVVTSGGINPHYQLESLASWANGYGAWLYMGIVVNFLIYVRVARYLRVHVGLKAFYQVFIIAGREFMDFAVFLLFILVVLGSAVFAFFQLTGGNYQFLRFADGLAVMTRLTFGFLNYEDFQAQALGVGAAVSAVTLLFWLAVVLLVVYTQNIILAIVAEAYEEAKAKLGSAETSFLMLVCMRLLFLFLYILYRAKMFCVDMLRLFTGKRQLTPSHQSRTVSNPAHPTDGGHGNDPGNGPGGNGTSSQPGSPRLGDDLFIGPPAGGFDGIDANPHPDQGDSGDSSPFAADDRNGMLAPQTSVMGTLPRDVEEGLRAGPVSSVAPVVRSHSRQPTGKFLFLKSNKSRARSPPTIDEVPGRMSIKQQHEQNISIKHRLKLLWYGLVSERHDVRMYQDLLLAPQKDEEGWIAAWKRRYWAPWCVARTRPVKGLMSLYQDFASYKLKEECTWPQAQEMAAVIFAPCHVTCLNDDVSPAVSSPVPFRLPALTDPTGYVDEATLARLFLLSSKMSKIVPICNSPFPELTLQSVSYLVQGISQVYGVDVEDIDDLGPDALAAAQGSLNSSGGSGLSKDARLGQVVPRRGTGFFGQLNVRRREGAEQSKQVTRMLHGQRRLEESAHKTERNLDLYRAQATQQANRTAIELNKQQAQQAEVLKAVKQLQATVHSLAAAQYGPGGSSFSSSIAPTAERAGSSKSGLRKGVSITKKVLHKTPGPGLARGGSDLAMLGSPPAADFAHDTFSTDEAGDAPAAAGVPSSVFSFNASSGPSRFSSDGQMADALASLQQQMAEQQRLLHQLLEAAARPA